MTLEERHALLTGRSNQKAPIVTLGGIVEIVTDEEVVIGFMEESENRSCDNTFLDHEGGGDFYL